METFSFNLNGFEHNQFVKHPATAQNTTPSNTKKLREFYAKNASMRAFLNGVEKREEKFITNGFRATEFETADRVIKKDTWDRSMLIVAEGQLISFC